MSYVRCFGLFADGEVGIQLQLRHNSPGLRISKNNDRDCEDKQAALQRCTGSMVTMGARESGGPSCT
jgi:hypothetical protein